MLPWVRPSVHRTDSVSERLANGLCSFFSVLPWTGRGRGPASSGSVPEHLRVPARATEGRPGGWQRRPASSPSP